MSISIDSILAPSRALAKQECTSKKRILELVAKTVAEDYPALDEDNLFKALINREKLGSTGLGSQIAIPHCRIEECTETIGVLITLASTVDFESIDNEPVDVIFALVVPDEAHEEHLNTLATLAERFSNRSFVGKLRDTDTSDSLYAAATTSTIIV